ncbi:hypothetical protein [Streptomyces sp. NBC_00872]|uniref:hypothetical protein n=1 Tax=Streptomyces sp. NBC_00872 TaxID=2903686 RepID=UPI003864AA87|nr:hypothetical protein OG214_11915 [Streptomyces sp. NBC_00872]
MGRFTACPQEALKAAEYLCGPVELKEITDRRGSAVWKATGATATVSVKFGYGEGAETTAREAAVLDQLPRYTVTAGRAAGGVWCVTPWLNGPSTFQLFQSIRDGSDRCTHVLGRSQALVGAVELCRAVADLHIAGWIHGDLQPSHGIHTLSGARLIDFAWTWREGEAPWPKFYGGITHLVAPELAAWITHGPQPVKPAASADVYALAGTLWTCTTGRWPLDYAAVGVRPDAGPVARRTAIATGTIPLDSATPWPTLQNVLRAVLLSGPDDRPTAAELGIALAEA